MDYRKQNSLDAGIQIEKHIGSEDVNEGGGSGHLGFNLKSTTIGDVIDLKLYGFNKRVKDVV